MWSGWKWVASTRVTGRPAMKPAQILPALPARLVGEAGIDQGPAVLGDQPDVHVVERERQREAGAEQPGRQLAGLAVDGKLDSLVGQRVSGRDAGR